MWLYVEYGTSLRNTGIEHTSSINHGFVTSCHYLFHYISMFREIESERTFLSIAAMCQSDLACFFSKDVAFTRPSNPSTSGLYRYFPCSLQTEHSIPLILESYSIQGKSSSRHYHTSNYFCKLELFVGVVALLLKHHQNQMWCGQHEFLP